MKRLLMLICLFSLFFCCSSQKTEWQGTIQEVDGVTIVNNPKEPIYQADVFFLEEEITIGKAEGRVEYLFQQIGGVAADDDANIYVCDTKARNIKVFDEQGEFIRQIGNGGQGPGELQYPREIHVYSREKLLVNDWNQTRLLIFSLTGDFISQYSTHKHLGLRHPKFDTQGNILANVSVLGTQPKIEIKRFDSQLNPTVTYVSNESISKPPRLQYFELRLDSNTIWDATANDLIFVGGLNKYEIDVYSLDGKHIRKILKNDTGIPISRTTRAELMKEFFGDTPVPNGYIIDFPKTFPPFMGISSDDKGRIFTQTFQKSSDEMSSYYDVFNSDGQYIAKISLKHKPQIWKNGKLYTIETDEEGYQYVKRYKVTWNY